MGWSVPSPDARVVPRGRGPGGRSALLRMQRLVRQGEAPEPLRRRRPTAVSGLFDGEESPRGTPDTTADFVRGGLRGSRVAAKAFGHASAMILLDFVGNRHLRLPRESYSNASLWSRLRAAARRVGRGAAFPDRTAGAISDDHVPFLRRGIPAIDLIDFDFPCWHRRCDDLSQVSP